MDNRSDRSPKKWLVSKVDRRDSTESSFNARAIMDTEVRPHKAIELHCV